MRRFSMGWTTLALGIAFAIPTLAIGANASAKTSGASAKSDQATSTSDDSLSKDDQAKLKEHNKLRNEIAHVKYPASKSEVVAHVKGIKPDDKKWFTETLPERTYSSADEVMSALGWETTAAGDDKPAPHPQQKPAKTSMNGKGEKAPK